MSLQILENAFRTPLNYARHARITINLVNIVELKNIVVAFSQLVTSINFGAWYLSLVSHSIL